MRLFLIAAALALPLASCGGLAGPSTPSTYAGQTTLDEKAALGVETAYTAAAKAASLAIRTGVVKDAATIKRIGEADRKAYAAVQAVRAAYVAGNAASYTAAFNQAQEAVTGILAAL